MKVYLAGPINGTTDGEANDWRSLAKKRLDEFGMETSDPMDRDYRGIEEMNVEQLVEDDKRDIIECDGMLACCWKPSVGTSMEILFAWEAGLQIVIVVPEGERVSPWLTYHADAVVTSVDAALDFLTSAYART